MDEGSLRAVLARAEEIEAGKHVDLRDDGLVQELVAAAAESGLSEEAVLQALREQQVSLKPPEKGEIVFAESSDGRHYVAKVLEVEHGTVHVRFLKGSERTVGLSQVKKLELTPGARVEVPWPGWGWWNSEVVAYNADAQTVTATDGMSRHSFPIAEIRLKKPLTMTQERWRRVWVGAALFAGGTGLGMLAMRLILR